MRIDTRKQTAVLSVVALAVTLSACGSEEDTADAPPSPSAPAPEVPSEEAPAEPTDEAPTEESTGAGPSEEAPAPETPSEDPPADETPSDDPGEDADAEREVLFSVADEVGAAYPDAELLSVGHNDGEDIVEEPVGNGYVAEVVRGDELLTLTLDPEQAIGDETTAAVDDETLAMLEESQVTMPDAIAAVEADGASGGDTFTMHSISLNGEGELSWYFTFYGAHDFGIIVDALSGEVWIPVG